jgi:4-hydroxy-tetrahydrodipicolinate reductase
MKEEVKQNHPKKIGIIVITGKVGILLQEEINKTKDLTVGLSFSRGSTHSLQDVMQDNDYIIDFSSPLLIKELLSSAIKNPKPLVICSTGWSREENSKDLNELSSKVPVIIAPNTSFAVCIQHLLAQQMARFFDHEYDIDILEKHHRYKIDIPSGTSEQLTKAIINSKKESHNIDYNAGTLEKGPRPNNFIGQTSTRSGGVFGEHEVIFTSDYDSISIKHVAFSRSLFAKGALKTIYWLIRKNPTPAIYSMLDIASVTTF